MADTKKDDDVEMVEREMLAGTFWDGQSLRRGDVVTVPAPVAERWESMTPPGCAEVGTLERQAQEQAEAEAELQKASDEARQKQFELAQARNRPAGVPDDKDDDGDNDGDDDGEAHRESGRATAGVGAGQKSTDRPNQSSTDGPTTTRRDGARDSGSSGRSGSRR